MTENISIAVIGGSGVYELKNVRVTGELDIKTPFGKPSDLITVAEIGSRRVAFLPRHGRGHRHLPAEVPSRANIYALKSLGVKKIVAVSAVGSLKEEIRPMDIVLPRQIIDKTRSRPHTFYGNGIVGHVAFADPFCENLRAPMKTVIEDYISNRKLDKRLFTEETYICMEGPQFSTRAESLLHKSWGAGVVGMTAVPEAKLAREAEICYASYAMPTDYDCWREEEQAVDGSMVQTYMKENNKTVNELLPRILEALDPDQECACHSAARYAVFTKPELIPARVKKDLGLLYGKYWR